MSDGSSTPSRAERRAIPWARLALALICGAQIGLALRPGSNSTPFQDEALYMYMGHRMIAHLLHGTFLPEYPGTYFSGAPGLYPVLAALGDHVDGLRGARLISLGFGVGATICVNGLGRELYGRRAGLLGALSFVLCGSVLFQSDFATFDATMMFLVAAAAWLTVWSVQRDDYRWWPAVSGLLVLAFYVKYGAAAYVPIIAGLAVTVAAANGRDWRRVARRTALMLAGGLVAGYAAYATWGGGLSQGIRTTTTSRIVENPASGAHLVHQVLLWVGPWIALAVVGAMLEWRRWLVPAVLLVGVVIAPLQQIRIGEDTSLDKHVAFGIVFAAPLIGLALARLLDAPRVLALPVVVGVFGGLGALGLHYSHQFMTSWPNDTALLPPLHQAIAAAPGQPILGEQPDSERWALRTDTAPAQWHDTYYLSYDGQSGDAAYKAAVDNRYFGVIYLIKQHYAGFDNGSPTTVGNYLYRYLSGGRTAYRLTASIPRIQNGHQVGDWYVFTLRH